MLDAIGLVPSADPLNGRFEVNRVFRRRLAILLVLLPLAARAEKVEQLKPQGYVNDFAGVIDPQNRARLTALCAEVDEKARAQIAVVTVRSLDGVPIEEFSHKLASRWGVGYKGNDRGVLILLAIQDHQYRIEVGYGLEPILPDGKVGGFGREIAPLLRQNDYGRPLFHLTSRMAEVIARERGVTLLTLQRPAAQSPPPTQPTPQPEEQLPLWLAVLIIILFIAFRLWIGGVLSGGGGSWGGGGGFGGFGGGSFGGGGVSLRW